MQQKVNKINLQNYLLKFKPEQNIKRLKNAIILLYKNEVKLNNNHRPINLLPVLYKIISVITNSIRKKLQTKVAFRTTLSY